MESLIGIRRNPQLLISHWTTREVADRAVAVLRSVATAQGTRETATPYPGMTVRGVTGPKNRRRQTQ